MTYPFLAAVRRPVRRPRSRSDVRPEDPQLVQSGDEPHAILPVDGSQAVPSGNEPQVRPAGVVIAMLRRDLGEGRLFGVPILLDIVFGTANLLVFLFISRVLQHPGQQGLGQSSTYFDFVAVGLAFMVVAQVSCTQLTSRVQDERRTGTLEVLVQAPVAKAAVALGMAAYPTMAGVLRAAVYLALACSVIGIDSGHADWFGVAVLLVLGAIATGGLALAIGAFAVTFHHGSAAARAVIIGVGFLSGAYFPTSGLPTIARALSALLPTRMAIDGLRAAIAGGHWLPFALLLAVTAAVLVPACTALFVAAISRSVRKGLLNHG